MFVAVACFWWCCLVLLVDLGVNRVLLVVFDVACCCLVVLRFVARCCKLRILVC